MSMKNLSIIIFIMFLLPVYSQHKKHGIVYTNTTVLELVLNKKSRYLNEQADSHKGGGISVTSLHGFFILKKISVSVGLEISFSLNEYYRSLPFIGEFRFYFYNYGVKGVYLLLNTGKNLEISSFKGGKTAKFGLGYVFEGESNFLYVVEFYNISKQFLGYNMDNKNYSIDGLGVSFGIKF